MKRLLILALICLLLTAWVDPPGQVDQPEGVPADCQIIEITLYTMPPFGDLYQMLCWDEWDEEG